MILTTENIQIEDKRKFVRLGRDYFLYDPETDFDPLKESQKNHKIFSLSLPDEIFENFLSKDNLTLFLLDYYKCMNSRQKEIGYSKDNIRESLFKWFLSKTKVEKDYAMMSLLKLSKANNLAFYDELMLISFLLKEKKHLKDPSVIDNKINYLSALAHSQENQFLNFILKLAKSFYHIELNEWELALYALNEIDAVYENSPNGFYYKSLIMLKLENLIESENMIEKVAEYDLKRLNFAIDNYSIKGFELFLLNSFLQNIFSIEEGPRLADKLSLLNASVQQNLVLLPKINTKLKALGAENLNEFKTEEILQKIKFFNLVISSFGNSRSYFFISSVNSLGEKLNSLISEITDKVEEKFAKMIAEMLVRFDEKISENKISIANLDENKREYLKREDDKNSRVITDYTEKITEEIRYYENLLERFEKDSSDSSFQALKNSLVYNTIFASFVLLSGGFAEYSNSYVSDIASFAGILSLVVVGGLKWGIVAFIIGFTFSIIMFLGSLHSRYERKNGLIQKISSLNAERDKGREVLRAKHEQRKKMQMDKFELTKKRLIDENEALIKSKEEEKQKLIEKFKEDKSAYLNNLQKLID